MDPIQPNHIRYIKLGRGGRWADVSLDRGEVHFGYREVPHEPAVARDWNAVRRVLAKKAKSAGKLTDRMREIRSFYELGSDCLWVTFARGHLWWAFAEDVVHWRGEDEAEGGRVRRTLGGWRNTDIQGNPLREGGLSSRLTRVSAYRGTLCEIADPDYLLRRINAVEEPLVVEANQLQQQQIALAGRMIAGLHWSDFETLIDILFARHGWHRITELGGTQKDVDLVLENPTTGDRAFVQIKSKAGLSQLNDYLTRFQQAQQYTRLFFVCHSPSGELANVRNPAPERTHIWVANELASRVVRAGLFDWVTEKLR